MHIYNLCPYKNKAGCADCRLTKKTIELYGYDYKTHPEWINACTHALGRAETHQDLLDGLVSDQTISEGVYLNQCTNFVMAFYNDLTWHHLYMINKYNEQLYASNI